MNGAKNIRWIAANLLLGDERPDHLRHTFDLANEEHHPFDTRASSWGKEATGVSAGKAEVNADGDGKTDSDAKSPPDPAKPLKSRLLKATMEKGKVVLRNEENEIVHVDEADMKMMTHWRLDGKFIHMPARGKDARGEQYPLSFPSMRRAPRKRPPAYWNRHEKRKAQRGGAILAIGTDEVPAIGN